MGMAEKEFEMAQKFNVKILFYNQPEFPQRLNRSECSDAPILLYMLGQCDLNNRHSVALVGSRKATDYGRSVTRRLVEEMQSDNTLIVSGLAYGIDTVAHAAALDMGLPTAAVLGHGLDRIYPSVNRPLAQQILNNGGALITEYCLNTPMSPAYFPARNRIIAALSDAVTVVEANERGGALITANIANSYQRDVFAVPGRLDDPCSMGCNNLVCSNKAILIRNAGDIFFQLGWKDTHDILQRENRQQELFATLDEKEMKIVNLLQENREMTLDDIVQKSGFPLPKSASMLVELELKNVIRTLPGQLYKLT